MLNMIWKDLTRVLRDKKALIIIILMPAILMSIVGLSIGKMMSSEVSINRMDIAIVNLDDNQNIQQDIVKFLSNFSGEGRIDQQQLNQISEAISEINIQDILFKDLLESEEIKKIISYRVMGLEEAQRLIDQDKIRAIVIIPKDFSYNTVISLITPFSNNTEIRVIKNPQNTITPRIVEQIFSGFTNHLSSIAIGKNVFLEAALEVGLGDKAMGELETLSKALVKEEGQNSSFKVSYRTIDKRDHISGMQYYAVGMSMMFVLYCATYGARYITSEKMRYTYQRMVIANVSKWSILMGRFVTTILITLIQLTALIIYSTFVLKIHWGNLGDVFLLSIMVSIAIGSLGVILSAVNLRLGSQKMADAFENVGIQLLAILGGSFVPMDGAPLIKKLGSFTPNGAAMEGYFKAMQGYSIAEMTNSLLVLSFISIVLLGAGLIIMRREGEV